MKHVKGLDTLRAFAVFSVIIYHWGPHQFKSDALTFIFTKVIPDGLFGVDLFFVLSGYLITNILLNAIEKNKDKSKWNIIRSFLIRRILRIFPAYFLLIFITWSLNDQFLKDNIFYFLTYTSNFLVYRVQVWQSILHTWSLAVEEQFYLLWPFVLIYFFGKYQLMLITLYLVTAIVWSVSLASANSFYFVLLPACIPPFIIGSIYACSNRNHAVQQQLSTVLLWLLPLAIILLAIHQAVYRLPQIRLVNSVIAINVIIYTVNGKYNSLSAVILNNKLFHHIGKISYGIYLYHYSLPGTCDKFADYLGERFQLNMPAIKFIKYPPSAYILHLCVLLLVAHFSYVLIERQFIGLKKYFPYTNQYA